MRTFVALLLTVSAVVLAEQLAIAFISSRDGDWEIFVMDSDGRNQTQLTFNDNFDSSPAWCPVE